MKTTKLKKWLSTFALVGAAITSTHSQAGSVWSVEKGDDIVYIGGTIHLLPPSEFPLPKQFDEIYAKSDSIVLEAKLPDPADTQAQMQMIQAMSFEPGKTLQDVLSPETFTALKDYFATMGVDVAQMAQFKPGFIATIMLAMEAQKAQMAGEGVDAYFAKRASEEGRPQEYLETLAFQTQMLASQGAGDEDRFIKTNLQHTEDFVPVMKALIKAWRAGDEATLNELVIDRMKQQSPEMFKTLLTERNNDWTGKIERMFGDQDKEFVLVGVGHLIGEQSVIAQLKNKGYKVTKL